MVPILNGTAPGRTKFFVGTATIAARHIRVAARLPFSSAVVLDARSGNAGVAHGCLHGPVASGRPAE